MKILSLQMVFFLGWFSLSSKFFGEHYFSLKYSILVVWKVWLNLLNSQFDISYFTKNLYLKILSQFLIFFAFRALKEYIGSIDSEYVKQNEDFYVGFEGSFGSRHVTARTLAAHYLGNLVCLEGIVTKCSLVSFFFIILNI